MTPLAVAFILIGLFGFIAAVADAAEGGPIRLIAALVVAGIAAFIPWRVR